MSQVILVRHPPVDTSWTGRCYGQSDVPLDSDNVTDLVDRLSERQPTIVWHSGLSRTTLVAEPLAESVNAELRLDRRLRERDFGDWEGQPWDEIYATSGSAMDGMIVEPETWRPPGGETTFELRDRVVAWSQALDAHHTHVVVTHGGPIAALRGTIASLPVAEWLPLVPSCGEALELTIPRLSEHSP